MAKTSIRRLSTGTVFGMAAIAQPVWAGTIVDAAKADGHFTRLLAANLTAGIAGLLAQPGPFTVFAPNDKSDAVFVMAANNMPLIFKREAGKLTVNGAHVIKGPMAVDNGLVHVLDTVMLPAMPLQAHY